MSMGAVALGVGLLSTGASVYGSNRATGAIEDSSDQAAAVQNRALDLQLALSRPQLEVGTSALGVLAEMFGLEPPSGVNFDSLGGNAFGGREGFERATAGLAPIPGATWKGRPVFTDGQGGVYASRGRDATVGRSGVEFLGQAAEGGRGLKFAGAGIKSASGRLSFRDGQFFDGRGQRALPVEVGEPIPLPDPADGPTGAQSGTNVLETMVANNPLIQFQQQQGEQAIARGAAARGLNQSGGTLKDLSRFNQGLASTGIQNFVLNPLFQLAGFGPQAAAQAGGAIGNNANNLSNLTMGAGNARASAFQNAGNIVGNLGSDLANLAMLRRGNLNPLEAQGLQNTQTGQLLAGPPRA